MAINLFEPIVSQDKLHADYRSVLQSEAYMPARAIINELFTRYVDVDGTFVDQFQTHGFNARLWELYLFAVSEELNLTLNRNFPSPDFYANSNEGEFFIEAVTANPSGSGKLADPREDKLWESYSIQKQMYLIQDFMAIKFGSPLFSKLSRKYWELKHVTNKPLVFAIADFTRGASMISSGTILLNYLYGYSHFWDKDENGKLNIYPSSIYEHEFGSKKIPSGFFKLEGAENISAVITNPSATISKFNRIGFERGHKSSVIMIRSGTCYRHDQNSDMPDSFSYIVGENKVKETWRESLSVYHNPNAVIPLSESLIPGVAHHHFKDGNIYSSIPKFHTYGSVTQLIRPR